MKQTFAEYKEWVDPVEPHVREAYEKALRKMKQLKPYEDALVGQTINADNTLSYISIYSKNHK